MINDNFNKIWNHIVTLQTLDNNFSNTNIKKALNEIGNPQYDYKTIHIGGTNGKGSTSNFIYSFLKTKFKTGLYLSPSVSHELELAQVNDKYIQEKEFVNIYNKHKRLIKKYKLTFFEIKTFIAFVWFRKQKVDYAVIEVGLGGIYDATNTLMPEACVVTNIGDDHSRYLGKSFKSKAINKIAIQKPNKLLFTSEPNLVKYSKYPKNIVVVKNEFYFNDFVKYQQSNYNIAISLLKHLGFDKQEVIKVIKKTKTLPFRFGKISENIYFDASHNIHGTKALIKSLDKSKKYIFIFSSLNYKNYLEMINILKKHGKVYLSNFNFSKDKYSFNAKSVSKNTNTHFIKNVDEIKINEKNTYLFTGSFYFLSLIKYAIINKVKDEKHSKQTKNLS